MGYTHYWSIKRPIGARKWGLIGHDIMELIVASPVPVQFENDDPKPAYVGSDMIRFNGTGDGGYETFLLEPGRTNFEFCKTGRRPYDIMVCAALIVLQHHAGKSVEVSSDGGMDGTIADYAGPHDKEWDDALAFVQCVLGNIYEMPPLILHRRDELKAA